MAKAIHAILHSPQDTLGTFGATLRSRGHSIREIIAPHASTKDFEAAADAETLIVMGGAMGVYEAQDYPFIAREIDILKKRIRSNSATLGICLGAQLLAASAGAKVYLSNQPEFGWYPVTPTPAGIQDPVLGPSFKNRQAPVFHWHQDTFDLPKSVLSLLSSERCQSQAFRLSSRIYGIQFHLELDATELPDWIVGEPDLPYGKEDGFQAKEDILGFGKRYGAESQLLAERILLNFLAQ